MVTYRLVYFKDSIVTAVVMEEVVSCGVITCIGLLMVEHLLFRAVLYSGG